MSSSKNVETSPRFVLSLFEFVVALRLETTPDPSIKVVYRYPDESIPLPKHIQKLFDSCVKFSFPDLELFSFYDPSDPDNPSSVLALERFSFVLTDEYGRRYFGYVLRYFDPPSALTPKAFALCSSTPLFSLFAHMLKEMASLAPSFLPSSLQHCSAFLSKVQATPLPALPGESFQVPCFASQLVSRWPFVLPNVGDSPLNYTDFQPLVRRIKPQLLLQLFCSLLLERRFIFIARHLSTLCSVVQAFVAFLYPLQWHHTYIPLMPRAMSDICAAPMPFILGIQSTTWGYVDESELEQDVIIVDVETGHLLSPPNADVALFPKSLTGPLAALFSSLAPKSSLKERLRTTAKETAKIKKNKKKKKEVQQEEPVDLIPPKAPTEQLISGLLAFHTAILAGYRNHFLPSAESYDFENQAFIKSAHPDLHAFLEQFVHTQLFEQFIADRAKKYAPSSSPTAQSPSSSPASLSSSLTPPIKNNHTPHANTNHNPANQKNTAPDDPSRFSSFQEAQHLTEVRRLLECAKLDDSSLDLSSSSSWGTLISLFPSLHPNYPLKISDLIYNIGRSPHCQAVISHPEISAEHCKLVLETGASKSLLSSRDDKRKLYCYDLSTNGTFINGKLIGKGNKSPVLPEDKITFCYPDDSPSAFAGFRCQFGNPPDQRPLSPPPSKPAPSPNAAAPKTAPTASAAKPISNLAPPPNSTAKSPPSSAARPNVKTLPRSVSDAAFARVPPSREAPFPSRDLPLTQTLPPLRKPSPPIREHPPARDSISPNQLSSARIAPFNNTRSVTSTSSSTSSTTTTPFNSSSSSSTTSQPRSNFPSSVGRGGTLRSAISPAAIKPPGASSQTPSSSSSSLSKTCSKCACQSPSTAKFCIGCGGVSFVPPPASSTTPSGSMNKRCTQCDAESPPTAKFCIQCASTSLIRPSVISTPKASQKEIICGKCNTTALPNAKFCTKCGLSFAPPSTAASPSLQSCKRCRVTSPPTAKYCIGCGFLFSNSSGSPAPSAVSRAAPVAKISPSAPVCDGCLHRTVHWWCAECTEPFCEICFDVTHRIGKFRNHPRQTYATVFGL